MSHDIRATCVSTELSCSACHMSESHPRTISVTHPSERRLRLVLIGDSGVGKTSLLSKYMNNEFDFTLISTCGIDFKSKTLDIDGQNVKLHLWDTAGQERFRSITPTYCRNANGIILVYDITDIRSFKSISFWTEEFSKYSPPNVDTMLLGSKIDLSLQRIVSKDMGRTAAESIKASFFEVSAVTGENINMAMENFVRTILQRQGFISICDQHQSSRIKVDEEIRQRRNSISPCCSQPQM